MAIASRCLLGAAAVALFAGCSSSPEPSPSIRVTGPGRSVSDIAGEWNGDYLLSDGSRRGSITFRLEPGDSLATGEVLMMPTTEVQTPVAGDPNSNPHPDRPPVAPLEVSFVTAADNKVRGTLRPYHDPECGCEVETSFDGKVAGDTIEGTFVIHNVVDGRNRTGRWSVHRKTDK